LPRAAKALVWVRVLNQLGAYALAFLAVLGLAATGVALLLLAAAHTPSKIVAAIALVGLAFEIYEPASQEPAQ
jgi:hypothetical protein